ncbi:MAG TPA: Asp-tRNA(Asn)/Glu-tRNA(Gln) amidotransferase subunit GatA [Myxococcota bacterium]|jgi:aspartyl-tRNA(Asn)/glutamyl-tRNA(Gln) amidotransferase subunit A|nr:Asp-tRNA(Asn)/Glu-tRNA(Gln) amidotransferase subunit GatA [Myxococcota bacterium]
MGPPLGTLAGLRADLDAKRVSSRELVDACLARAEALDRKLHAFLGLRAERARAEAAESDARRARGEVRGALEGIPVALKDNMVQRGEPTTCASRILEGFVSPYDATIVRRLQAAGAVIVGRTNLDEFAMGSSTENSAYGPSRNPWDVSRTPGGSSGGSAAAVAAGIVPLALGSDTGGSIRQPAACTGIVGMKPTYGRVSRYGLVAFASSLDQIGPFTRSAADCATALEVLCGHDPFDSTSLPEPVPRFSEALTGDVSGLVIGLPKEYFVEEGVDPAVLAAVRAAVAELEKAGAKTREVSLPHTKYGIACYYLIAPAEASSNLARYDGVRYGLRAKDAENLTELYCRTRSQGFGAEVKRRILLGTYVLSAGYYDAYYRKAQQVRTLVRRDFEGALAGCDVIATPTMPEVAFRIGEKSGDPLRMYLNDVYTVSANLAGVPGISIPCGFHEGMPIGLQLLGRILDEATLLRVADAYERCTDWHSRRPPETA